MSEKYQWEEGLLLSSPVFPKIVAEYQAYIDSGDFSKMEDRLMERLDGAPGDIAFYLPAYRAFVRKQQTDRASAFLALHVESLREHEDLASEISLLQTVLGFWQDCAYARRLLLEHLKTMYPQSPNFGNFARHLGISDRGTGIEKFRQLESWLRYDEGQVVYIPSKGVARVSEVNLKFGVVRMLLKNGEQLSFQIEGAVRQIQSLESGHFLARTVSEPEVLMRLARDDPGELLRRLFASVKRELALNELKEMLGTVVPDTQWNSWWAGARKDARLRVGTGSKPKLNWNDSVAAVRAGLLEEFSDASLRDKLEMLKKHASRSESMASEMAQVLIREAQGTIASDPALSLEIVLTVAGTAQCKGVALPGMAVELLSRSDAGVIIAGISSRTARKIALQTVAGSRNDWPLVYGALFRSETDASIFKVLYESLHTAGRDDILVPEVESALSHPESAPFFYLWLGREIPKRPELTRLANWSYLRSLLDLFDDGAFKEHYPVLRRLFDPGEAVDRSMETLDAPTGRTLLDALARVRDLEDYRKDTVRQKLFTLFPELHENRQNHLLVTRESLDKKMVEYETLVKRDIPNNAREIQRTREYGDLRENFKYHEARRQQELLSSRAKTLHDELVDARTIEPHTVDTSKISIGTRCSLQPGEGEGTPVTVTILGPWDSDPANNILSYTSAAAQTLLNTLKGSPVTFNGKNYVVAAIDLWSS